MLWRGHIRPRPWGAAMLSQRLAQALVVLIWVPGLICCFGTRNLLARGPPQTSSQGGGNFDRFAWPVATFSILRTIKKRSLINLNKCTKLGSHKRNGGAVSRDHCHNHPHCCCCCCCCCWHYSTACHTILHTVLLCNSWGVLAGLVTPTLSKTALSTAADAAAAAAINVLLLLLLLLLFTSPRIQ